MLIAEERSLVSSHVIITTQGINSWHSSCWMRARASPSLSHSQDLIDASVVVLLVACLAGIPRATVDLNDVST
jgi:hypothetical protein